MMTLARNALILSITKDTREIQELCATAGYSLLDTVVQVRTMPDRNYYLGKGRMENLVECVKTRYRENHSERGD